MHLYEMRIAIACLQKSLVPESHKAALVAACEAVLKDDKWGPPTIRDDVVPARPGAGGSEHKKQVSRPRHATLA